MKQNTDQLKKLNRGSERNEDEDHPMENNDSQEKEREGC